tara:strand:- start:23434 stop:24435 length:1002 start_codon:yes stop_codon:yes gene_type:complete
MKATQVQLLKTPTGLPQESDFSLAQIDMPVAESGQVLCETLFLSLDPYMRSQIAGRHLSGTVQPGDGMRGETVSRVLESHAAGLSTGDLVRVPGGWQSHSVHAANEVSALPDNGLPPSCYLSTLGMPGLTAYAGLHWLAHLRAGEIVVIPAATGGVGSVAGQLARLAGCTVIGVAGGEKKCRIAVEELGYSACIDRHSGSVAAELDRLCPEGIDVFLDLVGGELLHRVSERLRVGARVVLCGLMAEYNKDERMGGPPPALWIKSRATVYGLVVYDFEPRRAEFVEAMAPLIINGQILLREDKVQGLENAPALFCRLMRGENQGKAIVQVSDGK